MDQMQQLRTVWGGVPRKAQASIAAIAVATIVVLYLVVQMASSTDWVAIESGMQPAKTASAVKVLVDAKIAARIGDGGSSVQVPRESLDKARVALAEGNALGGSSY